MKLIDLADAYSAVQRVMEIRNADSLTILQVIRLREALKPIAEMNFTEEWKLVEEYADRDENGNPKIDGSKALIQDLERAEECRARLEKLHATEIDFSFPVIQFRKDELKQPFPLNGNEVLALRGFIEFGGD